MESDQGHPVRPGTPADGSLVVLAPQAAEGHTSFLWLTIREPSSSTLSPRALIRRQRARKLEASGRERSIFGLGRNVFREHGAQLELHLHLLKRYRDFYRAPLAIQLKAQLLTWSGVQ